MKKAESTASPVRVLAAPVLCGLIATLLFMLIGAMAVGAGRLSVELVPYAALVCIGAGSFLCSLLSARYANRSRFLWGLVGGGILFVLLFLLSLVWVGEPIAWLRVVLNAAVVLVLSFAGSVLGASIHKKKRRK